MELLELYSDVTGNMGKIFSSPYNVRRYLTGIFKKMYPNDQIKIHGPKETEDAEEYTVDVLRDIGGSSPILIESDEYFTRTVILNDFEGLEE